MVNQHVIQGYRQMQARVVALILRHDETRFRDLFDQREGQGLNLGIFSEYRDLAVLFQLHESLFDDIIPSITRRLSFASPRILTREELPARGRINWTRSFESTWDERPGEAPLTVYTQVLRRDFATPENLLAIMTLLEIAEHARQLLHHEHIQTGEQALVHPLHTIIERSERALQFNQFSSLRQQAQQQLDHGLIEEIEEQVAEHHNDASSAYGRLLEWRQRYRDLRLIERGTAAHETVGADPQRDNYLYQLWLFYELIDLLKQHNKLREHQVSSMRLQYTWGQNDTLYELHHDQKRPVYWKNAPGVRPDYYISRVNRREIKNNQHTYWREPGYLLDAKYYLPRDGDSMFSQAQKRMLADLQLVGERFGTLLFAYAPLNNTEPHYTTQTIEAPEDELLSLRQHLNIKGWQIPPNQDKQALDQYLSDLLDQVHAAIGTPIEISCQGIIGDVDTHTPNGQAIAKCETCGGPLAFCPKPHVSPSHIDRVCPKCDCLSNIRLCHIIGQQNATLPPSVVRSLSHQDLMQNIDNLKAWLKKQVDTNDSSDKADQMRKQIFDAIGAQAESYIKLSRADLTITANTLRENKFDEFWDTHSYALDETSRNMLVTGEYIWNEVSQTKLKDWAACVVQYLRAFEHELHRRFYNVCYDQRQGINLLIKEDRPLKPHEFTFGSINGYADNNHKDDYRFRSRTNWRILVTHVATPNKLSENQLYAWASQIKNLSQYRNKVAHTDHIDRQLAENIRNTILGTFGKPGKLFELCQQLKPA